MLSYSDYSAVVARRGDTVQAMALRVGLSANELAAYNGLPTSYVPTPGDELVLPPRAGGYSAGPSAAAASAPQALSQAPEPISAAAPAAAVTQASAASASAVETSAAPGGWSPSVVEGALQRSGNGSVAAGSPRLGTGASSGAGGSDVGYHDVSEGETIYSIARQYGVTPESLISWNALSGPDYTVTAGQVLVIPAAGSAGASSSSQPYPPGGEGTATPPPSSGAPLPADTVAAQPLASPNMSQYQSPPAEAPEPPAAAPVSAPAAPAAAPVQTASVEATPEPAAPAAAPGKLTRPVPGRIVSSFNRSGSGQRNDGVDFAATAGEPVSPPRPARWRWSRARWASGGISC